MATSSAVVQPSAAASGPLRRKPGALIYIATFLTLHLSVAWGSLFPAYLFFTSREGSSAVFLGGPLVGTLAAVPLPAWFPGSGGCSNFGQLIEVAIDTAARLVGRAGWAVGAFGFNQYQTRRKPKTSDEGANEAEKAVQRARDGGLGAKVGSLASNVKTRHVLDAVAAYTAVKALLPLRLALSIGLTPLVARRLAALRR